MEILKKPIICKTFKANGTRLVAYQFSANVELEWEHEITKLFFESVRASQLRVSLVQHVNEVYNTLRQDQISLS